jgi:hypothetical protein
MALIASPDPDGQRYEELVSALGGSRDTGQRTGEPLVEPVAKAAYPSADKDQLARFTAAIFHRCHGQSGWIALRGFLNKDKGRPPVASAWFPFGKGLIPAAIELATRVAGRTGDEAAVFSPPVALFGDELAKRRDGSEYRPATAANVVCAPAIVVELDARPLASLAKLVEVLGKPTVVISSGGVWTDAEGRAEDKLHVYWRLAVPATSADDRASLYRARGAATRLVSADASAVPLNHPMRWPGSWHTKTGTPRLCQIIGGDPQCEISLADAISALDAALAVDGLDIDRRRESASGERKGFKTEEEWPAEELMEAARLLPNEGLPWDAWNRFGMVFFDASHGSLDGLDAFHLWSEKDPRYDHETCEARWTHWGSSPPSNLSAATLVREIRETYPNYRKPPQPSPFDHLEPANDDGQTKAGDLFGTSDAQPTTPPPFDFAAASRLSPSEMQNIPDREFVLGSRFQPGTLTLGAGPAGVSKSTFVILSALSIAAGRSLTGELVGRSGRVLIYNAEDPRSEIMRRLIAMASFYGVPSDVVLDRVRVISGYDDRRLVFAERKERSGLIKAGADVDALASFVIAEGIVHVALDPLVSLHRGLEENSAADMEALGDQLRRFAQRTGVSVDLIHHTVKNRSGQANQNAGSADAARGSGAVMGFVRSAYTLMPMDQKDGADLGLSREQTAQLVRLDDAKRNYARRSAHEAWFELRSVLQTGEEIHPRDFGSSDPAVRRRAQSSVGVHVRFDIGRQRAASAMSKATDAEERLRTLRAFIVEAMETDAIARTALTADLKRAFDLSETTARTRIDEACPQDRRRAVSVEADGLVYDLWRELRRDGRAGEKWFVVRELKGTAAPVTDKLSAADVELEGAFG